ncbi:MAG: T9SS type A sorting domain-containing protein, partial [Olleya sp.]
FQLEDDWDLLYMEYSIDQGLNWTVLGTATDPNWYNNDTAQGENNTCFNCIGSQWSGTDAQSATMSEYSYDLTALNAETSIMFRFVFQSDQAVQEEGVIIDNFVIRGTDNLSVDQFETNNFMVYPNPSKGLFNIKTLSNQSFDVVVYDLTGKLIYNKLEAKTNNNLYQLDLSSFSTGVYFLNLQTNVGRITKKLIVN